MRPPEARAKVAKALRRLGLGAPGLALAVLGSFVLVTAAQALEPWVWDLPPRYPVPQVPEDNPMTVEGVGLGRLLFYDTRLSGNETQACASCHRQEIAFTDDRTVGIGSTGEAHPRNSMSLTNAAYASALNWANPLTVRLEQQALTPLFGEEPVELGLAGREGELVERLESDARYRRLFAEAFPGTSEPFTIQKITRALASFQRTLISVDTPFDDYFYRFDDSALSESALRGFDAFFTEKFECFHCHGSFNFSASTTWEGVTFHEPQFDNNALYNIDGQGAYPPNNRGILEITGNPADMGRFRAPTLRNVELTAPYMHDGSIETLEDVLVLHYARGGRLITEGPFAGDGRLSPLRSVFVPGFTLSPGELEDMLNLLRSLTDWRFVTNPRFSDPFVPAWCAADCDLDEEVTVGDVQDAVRVGLGGVSLARCLPGDTNADGEITVEEVVSAVNGLRGGCS
jgi:cytochrome c peroxidase